MFELTLESLNEVGPMSTMYEEWLEASMRLCENQIRVA
jgi:hypothetical protein